MPHSPDGPGDGPVDSPGPRTRPTLGEQLVRPNHAAPDAGAAASKERAGDQIGPFKLLEKIGEGGFGHVWLAERREPMVQRVALKIIKPGMDSAQVIARFEAERQALAVMDHPNVARVFDGGVTSTGRPYFVMEHVPGEPITTFCDRHTYTLRQRLELFIPVCEAVQHAHHKGIIHRDIKPSNILVATKDSRPVVKVIDFGVAKAISHTLTDKTIFTETGAIIGTPEYMSPEQAEMGALDIDTRTDVYSLGVVLYELLAGVLPFDPAELRSKGYAAIQQLIREREAPRPSTKLSTVAADTAAGIAAKRQEARERLTGELRRELEWIPLKALRKDRSRRYATPMDLADDVRRYMARRPLTAAPESRVYLVQKFVRRNRPQVLAVAAVVVALIAGFGTALWQAVEQRRRADELKQVSDFQSQMLGQIDAAKAGSDLIADLRERFAAASQKLGVPEGERTTQARTLGELLARVNATDAAAAMIDRTILKPAIVAIDRQFKDQPLVDAQLRKALADQYQAIGLYDAAFPLQESALDTRRRVLGTEHPDTLQSISSMGGLLCYQGKMDDAEPYLRQALEQRRRVLGEEHPDTLTSISDMGALLYYQGKLADAEAYYLELLKKQRHVLGSEHRDTLISINNMGSLLQAQGRMADAERYYREALEVRRRVLGEDAPDTLISINNLGSLLQDQGRLAEAEQLSREALEKNRRLLGEEHPSTLGFMTNMGYLLQAQRKLTEAERYDREALEKCRRVLGEEHSLTLVCIINLGSVLQELGSYSEAVDLLAPTEPAIRRAFTGGNARLVAAFICALCRARIGLGYEEERFKLVEPQLLEAHPILVKARGASHQDTLGCVRGLVDLYTAWDKADPGKDYGARAAQWKAKLDAATPSEPPKR